MSHKAGAGWAAQSSDDPRFGLSTLWVCAPKVDATLSNLRDAVRFWPHEFASFRRRHFVIASNLALGAAMSHTAAQPVKIPSDLLILYLPRFLNDLQDCEILIYNERPVGPSCEQAVIVEALARKRSA